MRMGRHIVFALALLLAISCGGRKKAAVPVALQDRAFPQPTVPTAYTEPEERLEYLADHYWDGFFNGAGTASANWKKSKSQILKETNNENTFNKWKSKRQKK